MGPEDLLFDPPGVPFDSTAPVASMKGGTVYRNDLGKHP